MYHVSLFFVYRIIQGVGKCGLKEICQHMSPKPFPFKTPKLTVNAKFISIS